MTSIRLKKVILDKWDGGIPKICHQMWLDIKQEDSNRVPSKYLNQIQSFKKHNPHVRHQLWNLRMVKLMFLNEPKLERWKDFWMNKMYKHIERCDFARYAILYVIGGVYIDLDFWTLRNWDTLLNHRTFGIAWEPQEHLDTSFDIVHRRLANGFLCSVPENPLLAEVMDYIMENYTEKHAMHNTGPCIWARFMHHEKGYSLSNQTIQENSNPQPSNIFVSTCDVMPLSHYSRVCNLCPSNALEKAYIVNYWNEGNGWENNSIQNELASVQLTNELYLVVDTVDIFDFFPEWNPEDICPDLIPRLLERQTFNNSSSSNINNQFTLYVSLVLSVFALILLIILIITILKTKN